MNFISTSYKKDILENEPRLARTYAYEISKGVQELMNKSMMPLPSIAK